MENGARGHLTTYQPPARVRLREATTMTTTTAPELAETMCELLDQYLRGRWAALVQAQTDWPGPALAEARLWARLPGDPFSTTIEPLRLGVGVTLDDLVATVEAAGYGFRRTLDGRPAWRVIPDHAGPWLSLDVERRAG
jgi:hypothetical protein